MYNTNTARRIQLPNFPLQLGQQRKESIIVSNLEYIEILSPDEIMYVQAESNYCTFIMHNGEKHLASRTLRYYQESLEKWNFFRPHQSYMANPAFLKRIRKIPSYSLCMSNGFEIPIAKSRRSDILELLTKS